MQALLVVDAQNEFSPKGQRAVPNHAQALETILKHVEVARKEGRPIAWIRHFNKPEESQAFVPGSWGSEFSVGIGAKAGAKSEKYFEKDVFGAFTGTGLEEWLRAMKVTEVLVVGFYAHMCVSTSVREALVRGFDVVIDPEATGACNLDHPVLGHQSADEVRRSAMLQVSNMGAKLFERNAVAAAAA